LFEPILGGRCELRAGWRRWQFTGQHYFLWQIAFGLSVLAALRLLIGAPLVSISKVSISR